MQLQSSEGNGFDFLRELPEVALQELFDYYSNGNSNSTTTVTTTSTTITTTATTTTPTITTTTSNAIATQREVAMTEPV